MRTQGGDDARGTRIERPWAIFFSPYGAPQSDQQSTSRGLHHAGVAGVVADGGAEVEGAVVADQLLDGDVNHWADFDQEHAAGAQLLG